MSTITYSFPIFGREMKILATQQSEDAYLRPYRDDNGDDEGGQGSTPSKGGKGVDLGILLLLCYLLSHTHKHTFFLFFSFFLFFKFFYFFIWPWGKTFGKFMFVLIAQFWAYCTYDSSFYFCFNEMINLWDN